MKKIYANLIFLLVFASSALHSKAQIISQLSFYSPLISTFDMRYINNHLVVSQNGLLIFDVTNPMTKPKLTSANIVSRQYSIHNGRTGKLCLHGRREQRDICCV